MYKPGTWNAYCDVCGFEFKSDQLQKRWDGLMVCSSDFELDHPQKYLRVNQENTSVPWARDMQDEFLTVCFLYERSAYSDLASADCATADNTTYPYLFLYNLKNAGAI